MTGDKTFIGKKAKQNILKFYSKKKIRIKQNIKNFCLPKKRKFEKIKNYAKIF